MNDSTAGDEDEARDAVDGTDMAIEVSFEILPSDLAEKKPVRAIRQPALIPPTDICTQVATAIGTRMLAKSWRQAFVYVSRW